MNEDKERGMIRKGIVKEMLGKIESQNDRKMEVIRSRKLDIKDEIEEVNNGWKTSNDSSKEVMEKQSNKEEASSVPIICKKLEIERDLKRQNDEDVIRGKLEEEIGKDGLKAREIVNKGGEYKNKNNLKEEIDKRLRSIERSIIYTQNNNLTELTKKIEILNEPLDIDRTRDITVLNTTDLSNNEENDRHVRNT